MIITLRGCAQIAYFPLQCRAGTLSRSGGFANIARHHEIDTTTLPPAEGTEIERLADAARRTPAVSAPMPDAFTYVITFDGARHVVTEISGAWGELIERLEQRDR